MLYINIRVIKKSQSGQKLLHLANDALQPRRTVPVELLDSMSSSLPYIRGQVGCSLLDGQHHNGDNYGNTDAGQNPQRTGSNELVWVLPQRDETTEPEAFITDKHLPQTHWTYRQVTSFYRQGQEVEILPWGPAGMCWLRAGPSPAAPPHTSPGRRIRAS